jgi:hypothetical protein
MIEFSKLPSGVAGRDQSIPTYTRRFGIWVRELKLIRWLLVARRQPRLFLVSCHEECRPNTIVSHGRNFQDLAENRRNQKDLAEFERMACFERVQPIEWLSTFRHGVPLFWAPTWKADAIVVVLLMEKVSTPRFNRGLETKRPEIVPRGRFSGSSIWRRLE